MKPTKNLALAILLLAGLFFFEELRTIAIVLSVVVAGMTVFDAVAVFTQSIPTVKRRISSSLAFGQESTVHLEINNECKHKIRLTVNDRCPLELNPTGMPLTESVQTDNALVIDYTIRPALRGDFDFHYVDIAVDSRIGFWQRVLHIGCEDHVRVYPDFSQITTYLKLLMVHQTIQLGIKKQIRRGEGLEFLQLREYRQADPLNRIDWKATSKRRSLISREFQDERSQQILFLVDTGRRMHSHDSEVSLFDRTLDAMTLLSFIALRQGDRVAVLCFGNEQRWIPSLSSLSSISELLHHTYDLHTGTVASDYIAAAEATLVRQRKRSLVVLLTSLRDDDQELPSALRLLATRHSVLLASLRENVLEESLNMDVQDIDDALAVLGAAKYVEERSNVLGNCKNSCHMVVDSRPQDFPVRIVNAYWQMKRSGQF
ncbi:MAG: DUF58 domain-containing protein [Gammaproteobacteria bacterium]|nr:DUF58 domain-containing protein [Gammaproteobacteria bacterium]